MTTSRNLVRIYAFYYIYLVQPFDINGLRSSIYAYIIHKQAVMITLIKHRKRRQQSKTDHTRPIPFSPGKKKKKKTPNWTNSTRTCSNWAWLHERTDKTVRLF